MTLVRIGMCVVSLHSINLPLFTRVLSEVFLFHICTQSFFRWAEDRMNMCPISQRASVLEQLEALLFAPPSANHSI